MHKQPCLSADVMDEIELVQQAKEEDATAFALLSEHYMPILRGCAGRYAKIDGVDTEDFIQEGLLALYRAVKGFDPCAGIRFRTYAIACINNSMISALRVHLKMQRLKGTLGTLEEQTMCVEGVEDLFIQMETNSQRQRQIEVLLSDFERRVLILHLSGQAYQEIAQSLRTTTKAVDNALQRVRRKLRPEF